jgi:hypothetical protein
MAQPKAVVPPGRPAEPKPAAHEVNLGPEFASGYCQRCSARLEQRSCKLICPGCPYYVSCSDFY